LASCELDACIGAPESHGFAVREAGALVSRTARVHRIPPRERDDRVSPLWWDETGESIALLLPSRQEIFLKIGIFIHRALTRVEWKKVGNPGEPLARGHGLNEADAPAGFS